MNLRLVLQLAAISQLMGASIEWSLPTRHSLNGIEDRIDFDFTSWQGKPLPSQASSPSCVTVKHNALLRLTRQYILKCWASETCPQIVLDHIHAQAREILQTCMSGQQYAREHGEPRSVEWWVQLRLSEEERLWMIMSSLIIGSDEVSKTLRLLGAGDLIDALTARQSHSQTLIWTPKVPAIERCNTCDELRYIAIGVVWARNLHYDGITQLPVDGSASLWSNLLSPNITDEELDRRSSLPLVFHYVLLGARCQVWQDLLNRFTESLEQCANRCSSDILCKSGNYDVRSQRCQLSSMSCTAHTRYNDVKLSNVAFFTKDDDSRFSWECSTHRTSWCRMSYGVDGWSPRAGHSLVVLGERLLLVGGHGVANSSFTDAYMSREVDIGGDPESSLALRDIPLGRLSDIWLFNTSMRKWHQLPVEGVSVGRSYHRVLAQKNGIEIYGGLTDLGNATAAACSLKGADVLKCTMGSVPAVVNGRHCHGVLRQPSGGVTVFGGRSGSGKLLSDVWSRNSDRIWRKGEHVLPFEGCISAVAVGNRVAVLGIDSHVFCTTDRYLSWSECYPMPFRFDHSKPILVSLELSGWIAVVGFSDIYLLDLSNSIPEWYRSDTFPNGIRLSAGAIVFHGKLWVAGGVTREGYYDMSTWVIGVKQIIDSAKVLPQSTTPPTLSSRVLLPHLQALLYNHLPWLLLSVSLLVTLVNSGWSQLVKTVALVILLDRYVQHRIDIAFNERQHTPEDMLKGIYETQIQTSLLAGVSNLPPSSEPLSMTSTSELLCRTPPCSRDGKCKDSYRSRVHNVISDTMSSSGTLCCSDLLHQILRDILKVLNSLNIPYTPIYGTLLGAVREKDHLAHTRDIDLMVSAAKWSSIAAELMERSFGGGRRRYIAALDEWEPKVLRICADYSGWDPVWFSAVNSRDDTVAVYLDMYDDNWWAIKDMELMGCSIPSNSGACDSHIGTVSLRELNLSTVAFPIECLEKLFGVDWAEPFVSLGYYLFVKTPSSMGFLLPPNPMEGVSTAEFQVPASCKETKLSPVMTTASFNFQVEVEQSENSMDHISVFLHFLEKTASGRVVTPGSHKTFPLGRKVKVEVHILNHQDSSRPFVKSFCRMVYPNLAWGWRKFVTREALEDKETWMDQQDNIVFQIRASVVKEDPNPLKPNEHEVRFNGREEYDIGDEFKSPPTWKGNYKFQVAVYPGGISTSPEEQPFLAAYIHLLDRLDTGHNHAMQLKLKLLNHKDVTQSIKWTAIHTFDSLRSSWGCCELIPLEALRTRELGWLNNDGEIVIRAAVFPVVTTGAHPPEIVSQ